jgi:hypothetical protein
MMTFYEMQCLDQEGKVIYTSKERTGVSRLCGTTNSATLSKTTVQGVIFTSIPNRNPRTRRCNPSKAHFNQVIKSEVRMNRMKRKGFPP